MPSRRSVSLIRLFIVDFAHELIHITGPFFLAERIKYPPVFQAIGTEDEAFEVSQITLFDEKLKKAGVESAAVVVEGAHHSFDMAAELGDEIHLSVIVPAVSFVEKLVRSSAESVPGLDSGTEARV